MVYGTENTSDVIGESHHILKQSDNTKAEDGQNWERPWNTNEIRKNSTNWTLAGDVGLLNCLQEFSQQLVSKTHEMEKVVDTLVHETKGACAKINNVINDFHMLSNLQFVENRVYEEDFSEDSPKESNQAYEKTKAEKEAEMLQRVSEALKLGLGVLDEAFEKVTVDEISDSEDEEDKSEGRTILEPKDPYENRPLPYVIGTQEFLKDDFAGLYEIVEEDVTEELVDEEEEEEDEEEDEESVTDLDESENEEDKKPVPAFPSKEVVKNDRFLPENVSEHSESESSDLFDGEVYENGFTPTSLEDKPVDIPKSRNPLLEELMSKTKPVVESSEKSEKVNKKPGVQKDENERNKVFEKDDDLFSNDDLLEDEESPFRKKTGLFASDIVFGNEKEELNEDLFVDKEKERTSSLLKIEKADKQVKTKNTNESDLFGEDESDEDPFSSFLKTSQPSFLAQDSKTTKSPLKDESKKVHSISSSSSRASSKEAINKTSKLAVQNSSDSLFGDDSDDDLFSGGKNQKKFDFNDTAKDDLFSSLPTAEKSTKNTKVEPVSQQLRTEKKPQLSLFEESDSFDLFSPTVTAPKVEKVADENDGQKSKSTAVIKEEKKSSLSLFEDSDTFDLFSPATSSKKPDTSALNFEKSSTSIVKDAKVSDIQAVKKHDINTSQDDEIFKVIEKSNTSIVKDTKVSDIHSVKKNDVNASPDDEIFEVSEKSNISLVKDTKGFDIQTVKKHDITVSQDDEIFNVKAENAIGERSVLSKTTTTENVNFDKPIDSSNTLSALNKDRVKIQVKRRKPTRKGRQALQNVDVHGEDTSDSLLKKTEPPVKENLVASDDLFASIEKSQETVTSSIFTSQSSYKKKEQEKKSLMSQLVSEVASSKVGKSTRLKVELEEEDEEDDLFSSLKGKMKKTVDSDSLFSSSSIHESSDVLVKDSLSEEQKKKSSSILDTESVLDDDDLFSDTAFKDFSTSISDKQSLFGLDDDDDDIFTVVKSNPKSVHTVPQNDEVATDPNEDIFAGFEKEKYEMFPTLLYDDDDDDIFVSSVKPNKTAPG